MDIVQGLTTAGWTRQLIGGVDCCRMDLVTHIVDGADYCMMDQVTFGVDGADYCMMDKVTGYKWG